MSDSLKNLKDINIKNIDLNKHKIFILEGTVLYRTVEENRDPLTPSGKECRFAKEPPRYSPQKYADAYKQGLGSFVGTGNICCAFTYYVAVRESGPYVENPATYKLILKANIDAIDMDSICASEGIPKPYISEDREGVWHEFYGQKVKALRYESAKDAAEYNLVMFPDWIENFKGKFKVERI